MVSTWIESAAKGRHGGPVRAGMWAAVVIGTHPIESDQEVWLEIQADDVLLGPLPAFWVENKGVNSLWHVPIPPQAVGARLHYRSSARRKGSPTVSSPYQDTVVRPNLPYPIEPSDIAPIAPEGLVGNRMITVRIDSRGSTYDVYFPTVGLHSDVRPAEGELPQSRSHFRAIVGGLAIGRRLNWFTERASWDVFQHYQGATNLLTTELGWRNGPVKVRITDFAAAANSLPKTSGGTESPGQYLKRFRVTNEGKEPLRSILGVAIQAEVNGGVGEPGLSWLDSGRTLLASNRGHGHANRKLARDATVEFAVALDDRGDVHCEPTGPNEAILLRWLDLPAGGSVTVDLLVSGAFTGWRGDPGTFEHWLKPALSWFRSADLDQVEQAAAMEWDAYTEILPSLYFPKPGYAVTLRRSALAMALHADAQWGRRLPPVTIGALAPTAGRERQSGPAGRSTASAIPRSAERSRSGFRGSAVRTGPTPTGTRNTRSTVGPSGKRQPSTRQRSSRGPSGTPIIGAPVTSTSSPRSGQWSSRPQRCRSASPATPGSCTSSRSVWSAPRASGISDSARFSTRTAQSLPWTSCRDAPGQPSSTRRKRPNATRAADAVWGARDSGAIVREANRISRGWLTPTTGDS